MDEQAAADAPDLSAEPDSAEVEETSLEYVGRWNRLVSTTNWEKGRIISEWRRQLMEAGAAPQDCTDEAWSRRAGNVSPQHVGRLRRVYDQFGEAYEEYSGLFWSHFQAGLDWHDAEMWLEGAVQNGWTVAQMRTRRWETLGSPADQEPKPEDVVAGELDEDVDPATDEIEADLQAETLGGSVGVVDALHSEDAVLDDARDAEPSDASPISEEAPPAEPFRPFENLSTLPDDLGEALQAFKLAILKHKLSGWKAISCEQVLQSLDALKQLAVAPSDD
jgi:hypothetical protein